MSAGGAFGGARGLAPRPPEKGVFPLDHYGECKAAKQAYLECLASHGDGAAPCAALARRYLECRMDRRAGVGGGDEGGEGRDGRHLGGPAAAAS